MSWLPRPIVVLLSLALAAHFVEASSPAGAAEPELTFLAVSAPETDLEKRSIRTAPRVVRRNGDADILQYKVLARTGEVLGGGTFGALHDVYGEVLLDGAKPRLSDNIGFSSLMHRGRRWFALTQFGDLPGALYLSELVQGQDGALIIVETRALETLHIGGLWAPRGGAVTPWDTHLGLESAPPDARAVEEAEAMTELTAHAGMAAFFRRSASDDDGTTLTVFREVIDPYRYGAIFEADVDHAGEAVIHRRYALGRAAPGGILAMPDGRTVYISDGAWGGGLYMFIADELADLSAGHLYAARWHQTASVAGGAADIDWVNLGHVREVDIARLLDHGVTFSDLFDRREPLDNGCPSGFSGIKTDSGAECLAVKPGMEGPASRLETRRFAAMKGATTEFVRGGGLAYDSVRRLLYMAVGAVDGPMTDADPETMGGGPGANHIALPRNPCGAVYAFTLKAVAGIPSERVATRAQPVVMGTPAANAGDSAIDHNDCALEGIASPTGLAFIPEDDTLIIAEDTARGHQNDAVWAWDVGTASLSRVQTTPYGAAPAGTAWFPHMGDWGYLFSAVAHPYGDSNREKAVSPAARRAYLGYIGPFRGRLFN